MEIVSADEFVRRTLGGRPCQMNVEPYGLAYFDCACGEGHILNEVDVIRELPGMRLVVQCGDAAVTCIKVKGILRFKGLHSLFGAREE